MTSVYDIGDQITLTAIFTESNTPVSPNDVACIVKAPDGTLSEPDVTGSGPYTAQVEPDQAGTWTYRFEGTGTYIAAGEREFLVRDKEVA